MLFIQAPAALWRKGELQTRRHVSDI